MKMSFQSINVGGFLFYMLQYNKALTALLAVLAQLPVSSRLGTVPSSISVCPLKSLQHVYRVKTLSAHTYIHNGAIKISGYLRM